MELWELMDELELFPPKRKVRMQRLTALPLMKRKLPPHGKGIETEFCVMHALMPVLIVCPGCCCADATVAMERGATTAASKRRAEAVLTALRCVRENADIKNKGRNNSDCDEGWVRFLRDFWGILNEGYINNPHTESGSHTRGVQR
jgi:hypothetical protein